MGKEPIGGRAAGGGGGAAMDRLLGNRFFHWETPSSLVRTEGLLSVPGYLTLLSSSSCTSMGRERWHRRLWPLQEWIT